MKDALRAVREELGPDALVLSTAFVPVRGLRGWLGAREVEVTAAAERMHVPEGRRRKAVPDAEAAGREVAARLQAGGMAPELARDIAAAMPTRRRRAATAETLRRALAEQLTRVAAADESYAPVEVFVGPPGVGKTTTIAKIAAQERARNGKRLGVLAADGFRVGAVEQLRRYAEIIGAPFAVARSADELEQVLDSMRRPLLLDTAGRSPNDAASRDMFRVLGRRQDVRMHLVLPAATPLSVAQRTLERFRDAAPSRLLLTKVDESESITPLLGLVRDSGIPLSYLGTGQSVPEDLVRATPAALAAWIVGETPGVGAVA